MPSTQEVLETLRDRYIGHPVDGRGVLVNHIKLEALRYKMLVDVLVVDDTLTIVRRQMTEEEAVKVLEDIDVSDPERAHGEADWVLIACAPTAVADAYARLEDSAPWWAAG